MKSEALKDSFNTGSSAIERNSRQSLESDIALWFIKEQKANQAPSLVTAAQAAKPKA